MERRAFLKAFGAVPIMAVPNYGFGDSNEASGLYATIDDEMKLVFASFKTLDMGEYSKRVAKLRVGREPKQTIDSFIVEGDRSWLAVRIGYIHDFIVVDGDQIHKFKVRLEENICQCNEDTVISILMLTPGDWTDEQIRANNKF